MLEHDVDTSSSFAVETPPGHPVSFSCPVPSGETHTPSSWTSSLPIVVRSHLSYPSHPSSTSCQLVFIIL